jgi:drug/metabolite transporter (DMT)-like permease
LALQTSTPLNVTLVAGSTPVFMLAIGAIFFKTAVRPAQWLGAALSIAGVLVVLSRGDVQQLLQVSFVVGDIYILLATFCWALYSWLLSQRNEPDEIRNNWAMFLMAQVIFGLGWAGMFTGAEWALTDARIVWGAPLIAALAFVSVGPAVLAYRCWGLGVQTAGPAVAGFFSNLTPLFAAIMSSMFLGDLPKIYHALAFGLIVSGIVVSSRRPN